MGQIEVNISYYFIFTGKKNYYIFYYFRYGVFEEYGYPGDKQYPLFYFDDEDELMPNFCTDETLIGRRE